MALNTLSFGLLIETLIEQNAETGRKQFLTSIIEHVFRGGFQFYMDQFKPYFLSRCETPGAQKLALLGAFTGGIALGGGAHIVAAALHAASLAPVVYHMEHLMTPHRRPQLTQFGPITSKKPTEAGAGRSS